MSITNAVSVNSSISIWGWYAVMVDSFKQGVDEVRKHDLPSTDINSHAHM